MNKLFANIGYILLVLNFILYFSGVFKNGKAYKIFTSYLFLLIFVQITALIFTALYNDNLFLSHFYFIGQFVFLSLFYKSIYKIEWQKKMVNSILLVGLILIGGQYLFEPSTFFKFNRFEIFITSFLVIVLAVIHLYNILDKKKEFYFLTIGIIFYLFSSTVIFLAGNLMAVISEKYSYFPWIINSLLVIVYHLFLFYEWKVSFYKKAIQQKALE